MDSSRRKDLKTPDDAASDDEQLHSLLGVLYADVSAEGMIGGIYKGLGAQLSRSTLAAAIMLPLVRNLKVVYLGGAQSLTKISKVQG